MCRRHGLRKLSPGLISEARDDTAAQVFRIGLTFLGAAAFCLLSLFSPDSALLASGDKINVPFAGPVSFAGFMLLGPALLIVLRIYLQIYVEHSERLDRLAHSMPVPRAPTLVPLQNPLIELFSGVIFYALLPATTLFFAWKAAVFPIWGAGLFAVAVGVIVGHVLLPFKKFIWRSNTLLRQSAAVVAGGIMLGLFAGGMMLGLGLIPRPFYLFRADLSAHWLVREDFSKANLSVANLSNSYLGGANLSGANLIEANLIGTHLVGAYLTDANLGGANLSGADLGAAKLMRANLVGTNLNGANLDDADLSSALLYDANLTRALLAAANLSRANLVSADLGGAIMYAANLSRANLSGAKMVGANLSGANLTYAILSAAKLDAANLSGAELPFANLNGADLDDANLSGADLSSSENLVQAQLDKACGNTKTKLPKDLTVKSCPANR